MLRLLSRGITRSALPHPWFDLDHPMLKADPQIMKLLKYKESIGKLVQKEPRDQSLEESNTDPAELYEMTNDAYFTDPPIMEMFIKLYAQYNPLKIIKDAESLPGFTFNPKIQLLEPYDSNYTYQEMNDAKVIDSRYVVSRFVPPKFKRLVDVYLQKVPIYGVVVPMEEHEQLLELHAAFDKEFHTFFFGEGAFFNEYERNMYRRYILTQVIYEEFIDNREIPFVTEEEDNFMLGMINWSGSADHEYRCFYKPHFREYIIQKELWQYPMNSVLAKFGRKLWFRNYYKNPKNFAGTVAVNLVDRLKRYFISREFNYGKDYAAFDLPGSFVARNNLLILHIWMINERLRILAYEIAKDISDYSLWERLTNSEIRTEVSSGKKVLKMIAYINEKLMKLFEKQTDKALYLLKIHPAQRKKIKSICEKQGEQVTYLLFKHFEKENKGYTDLDVLMQAIFFPQKQPLKDFPDFVFQIGEYVMKHREFLSGLTLEDLKASNIDWDVMRIDQNVVKLMKQARSQQDAPVYPQSPLDEFDLQIIETLESVLPEERRKKVLGSDSGNHIEEKYRPTSPFKSNKN